MTWSPQMIERWGERGIDYVHDMFLRHGVLRPMATLLATRDPQTLEAYPQPRGTLLIPTSFCSLSDRQIFSGKITELARRTAALGVVFASEAWEARPATPETRAAALAAARAGRLEQYPERMETLFYSFQRVGSSVARTWRASITRDANGKPSLGAFIEELDTVELVGLFTNLMPPVN